MFKDANFLRTKQRVDEEARGREGSDEESVGAGGTNMGAATGSEEETTSTLSSSTPVQGNDSRGRRTKLHTTTS